MSALLCRRRYELWFFPLISILTSDSESEKGKSSGKLRTIKSDDCAGDKLTFCQPSRSELTAHQHIYIVLVKFIVKWKFNQKHSWMNAVPDGALHSMTRNGICESIKILFQIIIFHEIYLHCKVSFISSLLAFDNCYLVNIIHITLDRCHLHSQWMSIEYRKIVNANFIEISRPMHCERIPSTSQYSNWFLIEICFALLK